MKVANEVTTDNYLHSKLNYGSEEFPFSAYEDRSDRFHSKVMGLHWHSQFQISMVLSGCVEFVIGNERLYLNRGEGIFINSNILHSLTLSDGLLKNMMFLDSFVSPPDSLISRRYVEPVKNSEMTYFIISREDGKSRKLAALVDSVFAEEEVNDPFREQRISCALVDMWGELYRVFQDSHQSSGERIPEKGSAMILRYERSKKMLEFIKLNFARTLTLDEIAESANISRSEALRCFKSSVHTTPMHYLSEYRVSQAKKLLSEGDSSIDTIAWKTGFSTTGYFCRVFKESAGETPSAYRKNKRKRVVEED